MFCHWTSVTGSFQLKRHTLSEFLIHSCPQHPVLFVCFYFRELGPAANALSPRGSLEQCNHLLTLLISTTAFLDGKSTGLETARTMSETPSKV